MMPERNHSNHRMRTHVSGDVPTIQLISLCRQRGWVAFDHRCNQLLRVGG